MTDLERLEKERSLRSRIDEIRERLTSNTITGRDRQLDLDLSVALHAELAGLEPGPDPRKEAEDAAALEKSQAWLEGKKAVVIERDRLRAVLKSPTALPADREAASAALAALPRAW